MTLAAVLGAYALVMFVLCPGDRLVGFPVHHDDFANLSIVRWHDVIQTYGFSPIPPRPVSYYALGALSAAGIPVYYLTLHALLIAYVVLVFGVLQRLLEVRRVSLLFAMAVAAAMLSYEQTVEYTKYTGLITNLLSATFAAAAMHLVMSQAARPGAVGPHGPPAQTIAAVWVLAALSFWSKEDFILPAVLLAAYLSAEARMQFGAHNRRWWVLTGGLAVLASVCFLYQASVNSPFTNARVGPYVLTLWADPDIGTGVFVIESGGHGTTQHDNPAA